MQSETAPISTKKPPRYQAPRHAFDRRSKAAKRFAMLVHQFAEELGGTTMLSEARMSMIRQLASIILQAENMQAAIVRGEEVDAEQLVRVSNLQARLTKSLGIGEAKRAGAPAPNLQSYLAGRP